MPKITEIDETSGIDVEVGGRERAESDASLAVVVHQPEQSPTCALIRMAAPFSLARLIAVGGDFCGVVMLSKVNQETLAASALMTTTQRAVISTGLASLYSAGILAGRNYGAQNFPEVGAVVRGSLVQSAMISVPSALITYFISPIMRSIGETEAVANLVGDYFRGFTIGIPATYGLGTLQQTALGVSRPALASAIIGVNTALTLGAGYTLIFGKFGFPRMGAYGLGLSNSISAWATFLGYSVYYGTSRSFRDYEINNVCSGNILSTAKDLIKLGAPIGVQVGSECIGLMFTTTFVGWLGSDELSASQIALQYLSLLILPIFGLGQAGGVLVSQAVGGENYQRARALGRSGNVLGLSISAAALIVVAAAPRLLMSPFIDVDDPNNAQIVSYTTSLLIINGVGQLADTVRNVSAGMLRGFRDTKFAMSMGVVSMGAIGLTLSYVFGFPLDLGLEGIFNARNIGIATGGVVMFCRWLRRSRDPVPVAEQPAPRRGFFSRLFGRRNVVDDRTPLLGNTAALQPN